MDASLFYIVENLKDRETLLRVISTIFSAFSCRQFSSLLNLRWSKVTLEFYVRRCLLTQTGCR